MEGRGTERSVKNEKGEDEEEAGKNVFKGRFFSSIFNPDWVAEAQS